ncbi:PilZ domain-containing protein [Rhizobium helianthi]|uniref:PilZ domain-containing protein n=1 Tax=Rhizobium helianthi TaxID=1132695 RepID=A0ABW4LY05_9HYPH
MAHGQGDGRRAERMRCNFRSIVYFMDEIVDASVSDISKTGLCLNLRGWLSAKPGATIQLRCNELGLIEGTIRWYRAGKMGIKLAESSNTQAQVASFFKHYYKPQMPVVAAPARMVAGRR